MRTCNDGSRQPPRLRLDLALGTLADLPAHSAGPRGASPAEVLRAIRDAGFEGVQGGEPAPCRAAGLRWTGGSRVLRVDEAAREVGASAERGDGCLTLHVGTGLEDDAEMDRLVAAILAAADRFNHPVFIETHRATITQDFWRTVQLVRRFPNVRFNGDFSHWYTGLEMVYGDWDAKLEFLAPVFERVRFVHGRIGSPGCMQVHFDRESDLPAVAHFRELWTRSFMGFLRTASPGDFLCFTPELLSPQIYYARVFPSPGGPVEEGDRWVQARRYGDIATECFAEARRRLGR